MTTPKTTTNQPKSTAQVSEEKLQAGILKGTGRNFRAFLFVEFWTQVDAKEIKEVFGKINWTSAAEQRKQSKNCNEGDKRKEETVYNLAFTSHGLKRVEALRGDEFEDHCEFLNGLKSRREDLTDPPVHEWEEVFQKQIHAMIIVGNDHLDLLEEALNDLKVTWQGCFNLLAEERGEKLLNNNKQTIEHFGYVDGISQPLFELSKKATTENWDPLASTDLALIQDPLVKGDPEACGSFLVYRKLEQNVKGFKEAEHALAEKLGFDEATEELAGALIVGRFENGLPVMKFGSEIDPESSSAFNDFNYDLDPDGARCPFHAHIRKSNPRGDSQRAFGESEESEKSHRIVRRGITYDYAGRNGNLEFLPEKAVGLHFICFQSSIKNQFEFIQRHWVNNNDFPQAFTGIDPVIGQGENRNDNQGNVAEQKWTNVHRNQQAESFAGFVKMLGGEYFYSPSITFLETFNSTKTN